MALPKLATLQTGNQVMDRIQASLDATLQPLLSNALAGGVLLTGRALVQGVTTVNHGLGRKITGWIIVDRDAAATIYRQAGVNAQSDRTLVLVSSAAVNVSLYVF